jgi:hypothetical protein
MRLAVAQTMPAVLRGLGRDGEPLLPDLLDLPVNSFLLPTLA